MSDWFWVLWAVLAAILIVAEVFTSGFVLSCLGIGALAAAFAVLIGIDSLLVQFVIFVVVSIGLTAASCTTFISYFSRVRIGELLCIGVDAPLVNVRTAVSSSN